MQDEIEGALPEIPFYWDLTSRSASRFRAHDIRHSRPVDITVLDATTLDAATAERVDEAVAGLTDLGGHPAVVGLVDHGSTGDGSRYLVWPVVDGPLLTDTGIGTGTGTGKSELEPSFAIGIGADLADGLAALHRRGIAHGNVHPGNMTLTADGRAVLGPIDLAVGTGRPPTPADDIFGLGAVLARAGDDHAAAANGTETDSFTELVAAMTSPDPGDRPSMEEVARRLDRLRPEPGAEAGPDIGDAPRTVLSVGKPPVDTMPAPPDAAATPRRLLMIALAATALVATAGFAALVLLNRGASTEAATADRTELRSTDIRPGSDDGDPEPEATENPEPAAAGPSAGAGPTTLEGATGSASTAPTTDDREPSTTPTTRRTTTTAAPPTTRRTTTTSSSTTRSETTPSDTAGRTSVTTGPTAQPTTTRRTTTTASPTTERTATTAAPTTRRTTTTRPTTTGVPTTRRTTTTAVPTTRAVDCTWREPSDFISNFVMTARAADDLYSNTDTTCAANRSIAAGDRFRVIAEEPGWFYGQRESSGLYGWAPASNLAGCRPVGPDSFISNLTLTPNRATGLRARPQTGCVLMTNVGTGQSVKIVAEQGTWYYGQLTTGGLWGWIPKAHLDG